LSVHAQSPSGVFAKLGVITPIMTCCTTCWAVAILPHPLQPAAQGDWGWKNDCFILGDTGLCTGRTDFCRRSCTAWLYTSVWDMHHSFWSSYRVCASIWCLRQQPPGPPLCSLQRGQTQRPLEFQFPDL